jgi:trimethylamine--corrinoid protein Co-methyltransferase
MAGLNLIHDVGYMDMSMACGVEQLVMGNDIVGMAKRFLRGMDVDEEHLAMDVIGKVGPGGHFMQQRHTMNHFRTQLWRPKVFTRKPYTAWKEDGSKDTGARVKEEIVRILETHQPEALPDKVLDELERIKTEGEKELVDL